jgi:tetratricopeptide (TPR) repeat protein
MTMLGQSLVYQKRFGDAEAMLKSALAAREKVYGPNHPRVASSLNELGTLALKTGRFDEAASNYSRMVQIYKAAYNDKHYLISIALGNLASVYMERKQYAESERLFLEAIRRYVGILPDNHLNVAIAKAKLGRVLLREHRFSDAQKYSTAAYASFQEQKVPPASRLHEVRKDLVEIYTGLRSSADADRFRVELARETAPPAGTTAVAKK